MADYTKEEWTRAYDNMLSDPETPEDIKEVVESIFGVTKDKAIAIQAVSVLVNWMAVKTREMLKDFPFA